MNEYILKQLFVIFKGVNPPEQDNNKYNTLYLSISLQIQSNLSNGLGHFNFKKYMDIFNKKNFNRL
jgi:hypothetical protein